MNTRLPREAPPEGHGGLGKRTEMLLKGHWQGSYFPIAPNPPKQEGYQLSVDQEQLGEAGYAVDTTAICAFTGV